MPANTLDVRADALNAMLDSPLGRRVAAMPEADLASLLLNDAYKPKMHRLYALSYGGVTADFVLNVRRTPFPLKRIRTEACLCLERWLPISFTSRKGLAVAAPV